MKAVVYEKYGPPEVLHLAEIETPVPGDKDVLIKVHAATATLYDCWVRSATAPPGFGLISRIASGFNTPKQPIIGTEFSGEIAAVGKDVTRFKVGDPVFGFSGMRLGTYAEYMCLPEDGMLVPKPTNLTYEEAAAVPYGALTALHFLSSANIQTGQNVLVFGASGGVGYYGVQIAKYLGAEVTGVCSGAKADMVKSLGADHVIDYKKEDFTQRGESYDVIFDTIGKSPFSGSVRSLNKGGFYLFATFGLTRVFRILWLKLTNRSKNTGPLDVVEEKTDNLEFLKELAEAGELRPIIDRCFPFEQAAAAHRYVEAGKKTGSVVISVANHNQS